MAYHDDAALQDVAKVLLSRRDLGRVLGAALRKAFDEVLDGSRTGRWDINQLSKTEKTYIGTKVEIVLSDELELKPGSKLDAMIAGHEVDIKFSIHRCKQMIPTEAFGELCILVWADDSVSRFSVGLFRAHEELLTKPNKDKKRSLSVAARDHVHWLVTEQDGKLPENFLLNLEAEIRSKILSKPTGQTRVNEMFRLCQNRVISREAVVTVARQKDGLKRVRDARRMLLKEGIHILGNLKEDRAVAKAKGLPLVVLGEFISTQLQGDHVHLLAKGIRMPADDARMTSGDMGR